MKIYEDSFKVRSEKSIDELAKYLMMNCAVKNTNPFEEPLDISSYKHYCKIEWNKINFGWTAHPGVEIEGVVSPADSATIINCKIIGFKFHFFFYLVFAIVGIVMILKEYLTHKTITEEFVFFAIMIIVGVFKVNVIRKDLHLRKVEFIGFIEKS